MITAEYIHSDDSTILTAHMIDGCLVIYFLYDEWIPPGTWYAFSKQENEMLIRLLTKAKRLCFQKSL